MLADEGIRLVDSTALLKPLLAASGVLTKRKPNEDEEKDMRLWTPDRQRAGRARCRPERRHLRAGLRRDRSDGRHRRDAAAGRALVNGSPLRLVKARARRKHLLFDVPVAGPGHDRGDARNRNHRAGRGCGPHAAAG